MMVQTVSMIIHSGEYHSMVIIFVSKPFHSPAARHIIQIVQASTSLTDRTDIQLQ